MFSLIGPAEWTLLGFLAYCGTRLGLAARVSLEGTNVANFPALQFFYLFGAVLLLKLSRAFAAVLPAEACGGRGRLLRQAASVLVMGLATLVMVSFHESHRSWLWRLRALPVIALGTVTAAMGLVTHARGRAGLGAGNLELGRFALDAGARLGRELRRWAPLLLLISLYPLIPLVINAAGVGDKDAALTALDTRLFLGHDPMLLAQRLIWAPLSEWLAFCYTTYGYVFFAVASVLYLKVDERPVRWFIFTMSLTLALGYIGYSLVPAQGPIFTRKFDVSLDLYYMDWVKSSLIDRTRINRDCFPSLHTAISIVMLWACRRHIRPLFWVCAPILASVPIACVYLRYHYVVDVVAGVLLATGTLYVGDLIATRGNKFVD